MAVPIRTVLEDAKQKRIPALTPVMIVHVMENAKTVNAKQNMIETASFVQAANNSMIMQNQTNLMEL